MLRPSNIHNSVPAIPDRWIQRPSAQPSPQREATRLSLTSGPSTARAVLPSPGLFIPTPAQISEIESLTKDLEFKRLICDKATLDCLNAMEMLCLDHARVSERDVELNKTRELRSSYRSHVKRYSEMVKDLSQARELRLSVMALQYMSAALPTEIVELIFERVVLQALPCVPIDIGVSITEPELRSALLGDSSDAINLETVLYDVFLKHARFYGTREHYKVAFEGPFQSNVPTIRHVLLDIELRLPIPDDYDTLLDWHLHEMPERAYNAIRTIVIRMTMGCLPPFIRGSLSQWTDGLRYKLLWHAIHVRRNFPGKVVALKVVGHTGISPGGHETAHVLILPSDTLEKAKAKLNTWLRQMSRY